MARWMTFKAKYKSKCAGCDNPIMPGDSIRWLKSTKESMHNKCFKRRFKSDSI